MSDQIIWTNDTRKLSDLVPWDKNPREISDDEAKQLQASIRKFGQVKAYAISPDNEIYDGHQRQHVMFMMQEYGADCLVDVRVSNRKLTEDERKELVIRLHDNVGHWELDSIWSMYDYSQLQDWGFDNELLKKYDFKELDKKDPGPQGDDAAEDLQQKWGVESGQMWELGVHRIICGDCTDPDVLSRLMGDDKVNLMWTDPPYHVGKVFEGGFDEGKIWDYEFQEKWQAVCTQYIGDGSQQYICFAQAQLQHAITDYQPRRVLIWCKPFALMRSNSWDWAYELIAWKFEGDQPVYFRKPDGTKSYDWQEIASVIHGHEGKYHITQKPIALPALHIQASCPPGGWVLDPFLGSGTTLIACDQLGMVCRGVEMEPQYIGAVLERWSLMTGETPQIIDEL